MPGVILTRLSNRLFEGNLAGAVQVVQQKMNIFTTRKRSLGQFFLHLSVILFTGGGGGSIWAGTLHWQVRPRTLWQVHPPPWEQCMLGDTGNKRAVRILLECILVTKYCYQVPVPTSETFLFLGFMYHSGVFHVTC